ncbi:hypothetical protein M422DRAFT_780100 [Sphaerobolus stellatus SS14]|uniref:Uncharacterized protein n=1 Tax=Sphaerobolus stellatus (strain SS14) TaxID=990650 RepID=A0A0C9VU97_SPHS4|nr:hypothetical protein M422DRAFT_780100 [Sphaerobolus stellatus SS14]
MSSTSISSVSVSVNFGDLHVSAGQTEWEVGQICAVQASLLVTMSCAHLSCAKILPVHLRAHKDRIERILKSDSWKGPRPAIITQLDNETGTPSEALLMATLEGQPLASINNPELHPLDFAIVSPTSTGLKSQLVITTTPPWERTPQYIYLFPITLKPKDRLTLWRAPISSVNADPWYLVSVSDLGKLNAASGARQTYWRNKPSISPSSVITNSRNRNTSSTPVLPIPRVSDQETTPQDTQLPHSTLNRSHKPPSTVEKTRAQLSRLKLLGINPFKFNRANASCSNVNRGSIFQAIPRNMVEITI